MKITQKLLTAARRMTIRRLDKAYRVKRVTWRDVVGR